MGGMGGMSGMGMQPTGQPQGGSYSFLNAPPAQGSFGGPQRGGAFSGQGMQAQMTGFPGGGASGLMPQQTGYGMMSQPTGMGGGLMSQPTGMGMRPQPTGMHDPRLGAMMQTFMPSNLSQVSYATWGKLTNSHSRLLELHSSVKAQASRLPTLSNHCSATRMSRRPRSHGLLQSRRRRITTKSSVRGKKEMDSSRARLRGRCLASLAWVRMT